MSGFERLTLPAADGGAVTPNDSANLPVPARGLYVGVSGDVKIDFPSGATVTFVGLAAGIVHPIRARKVYATGTTATGIVAVF